MAEKCMLSSQIVGSDAYLDLPFSSQALYVQLNLKADFDGFVGNPKSIARLVGATEEDLNRLKDAKFILGFESSTVIVIKHWRINNTMRWDRHVPTVYQKEASELGIRANGSYTRIEAKTAAKIEIENRSEIERNDANISNDEIALIPYNQSLKSHWQPTGNQMASELNRIELNRIELKNKDLRKRLKKNTLSISSTADSVDESGSKKSNRFVIPTIQEIKAYCDEKGYTVDAEVFYNFYDSKNWMVGKNKMTSWKGAVGGTWNRKGNNSQKGNYVAPTHKNTVAGKKVKFIEEDS